MNVFELLKNGWRPCLATTLIAMLWFNYIVAPLLGRSITPLPTEFWTLFTVFCGVYGAGRSWEKSKGKAEDGL